MIKLPYRHANGFAVLSLRSAQIFFADFFFSFSHLNWKSGFGARFLLKIKKKKTTKLDSNDVRRIWKVATSKMATISAKSEHNKKIKRNKLFLDSKQIRQHSLHLGSVPFSTRLRNEIMLIKVGVCRKWNIKTHAEVEK